MTGAKALMTAMEKEGVKQVFGLPGGANLPMYDEFARCDIRHILTRHEQSAAHMADGFGRVSRKPGVCFATSGPGATNILTGLATAQADSAPMIAVTGQVPVAMIGRDAFQESDIIGMANPVVKYAFQPRLPEEVPEAVKKGFYIAETGDLDLYFLISLKTFSKMKHLWIFLMNLKYKVIILGMILTLLLLKKQLICYLILKNQLF